MALVVTFLCLSDVVDAFFGLPVDYCGSCKTGTGDGSMLLVLSMAKGRARSVQGQFAKFLMCEMSVHCLLE